MVENDFSGVLFLTSDLTRVMVESTIDELNRFFPELKSSLSRDLMVEGILNRREFFKTHDRSKFHLHFISDKVKFSFINWEKGLSYSFMCGGRRQIFYEIWSLKGAWQDFINRPSMAKKMIKPFCIIAEGLNAYLGFVGHELCLHDESIPIKGTNYYEELIMKQNYSTFFFDSTLAEEVGLEYLRSWRIFLKTEHSGYFVSRAEPPFISGLNTDDIDKIAPPIIRRLRKEFATISCQKE